MTDVDIHETGYVPYEAFRAKLRDRILNTEEKSAQGKKKGPPRKAANSSSWFGLGLSVTNQQRQLTVSLMKEIATTTTTTTIALTAMTVINEAMLSAWYAHHGHIPRQQDISEQPS